MLPCIVHKSAIKDLESIKLLSKNDWAMLTVTIQEMKGNQDCQDYMLIHGEEWNDLNCKRIKTQNDQNRDIWRLRRFDRLKKYRIIYAFQAAMQGNKPKFLVLAIANKDDYNYEPDHELTERISNDYDSEIF